MNKPAKKKKPGEKLNNASPEYDSVREQTVLLENMNQGIKTIAEQHGDIIKRLDKIDAKLQKDEAVRFKIEWGIESLQNRAGTVDAKLDRIESELKTVEAAVTDDSRRIKKLEQGQDKIEQGQEEIKQKLNTVITGHEQRIVKLEEKVLT